MTTDAERGDFMKWLQGWFVEFKAVTAELESQCLQATKPEPVADDLVDDLVVRMRVQPWEMGSNDDDRRTRVIEEREEALARITSDAATIAAKDAEIERLRNYCGAAARDYAGTLAALEEAVGAPLLEYFPHTARDLRETSEFMALAAEGKEDPTRWGAELNDAKARITELQAEVERKDKAVKRKDKALRAAIEALEEYNECATYLNPIRAALITGESDAG